MHFDRFPFFAVTLSVLAACGGNVVFVADGDTGSGGGGSTTSVTTDSSTSSVMTGSSCDVLLADLEDAQRAATTCDPLLSTPQCDGTAILDDTCACPSVLANEKQPDLVASAQAAYDAWVNQGCGPFECGAACFPAGPGFCQPQFDGKTGICVYAEPL
ncbi:MAG TPA: hypothetical protein VL400_10610 [Polyangiaceae bacterium]|jgi:hypothetical protein|nr:hypothetical protein [Polyangiaceae bacterium]